MVVLKTIFLSPEERETRWRAIYYSGMRLDPEYYSLSHSFIPSFLPQLFIPHICARHIIEQNWHQLLLSCLFIFFFLPGWLDQLAWTLSLWPRALARDEGSKSTERVSGALDIGPSLSCSHLHPPGPRHSKDEGGRGGEGQGAGMEAPSGGCLDNIRNRGQGLFRRRGLCFLHQSLPLGAGRRKGLDVAETGPAGAAQTPPPSPRPEPWHLMHPARANPKLNIPLRSAPASRDGVLISETRWEQLR